MKAIEALKKKGTYLEGEAYTKPTGILRLQINGALTDWWPEDSGPMSRAQYMDMVPYIADWIQALCEDWGEVIRGIKDKPISLERVRGKRK